VIAIVGAEAVLTVMVTGVDVTVDVEIQAALEVNVHVITSPLFNVDELNTVVFVPTFEPFSFHWYTGLVPPFEGVAVKVID
jgi:hypothetical protein